MARLTNRQRNTIEAALHDLARARRFLGNPDIAVARKARTATTMLHYTRADGSTLYELDKQFGSDLNGLDVGIASLRALLNDSVTTTTSH
jgi:hypothetical protein